MSFTPQESDPSTPAEIVEAAAASWLSLRDRGMSPAETAKFVQWLQQDPQHAAVFSDLDRVWKTFDRLGAAPAEIAIAATDPDLLAPRVRRHRHPTLAWVSLGAAAAVAVLLTVFSALRVSRHTAETAIGAFQKIDLADGSVAQLNTDSAIDVAFNATERRVRIVRGEVFFSVAKDSARPFIVTTEQVAVQAVGTAFNVHRRDGTVEILVTEGRVRVADSRISKSLLPPGQTPEDPPLLLAGERAVVSIPPSTLEGATPRATVEKVSASATRRALAWQERRLEFDAVPLTDVAREFNRYNQQQLVISDPALAAKRFSGNFRADGYESFVRLLESDFSVTVTRHERSIILRSGR